MLWCHIVVRQHYGRLRHVDQGIGLYISYSAPLGYSTFESLYRISAIGFHLQIP